MKILALAAVALVCGLLLWTFGTRGDGPALAGLEPTVSGDGPPAPAGIVVDGGGLAPPAEIDAGPEPGELQEGEAAEVRRPVKESGLDAVVGRVLDEVSGDPKPGFGVILSGSGEVLATVRTDEGGAFSFGPRVLRGNRLEVRVEPPEGWVVERPQRSVGGGGATTVELEFLAKPWPPEVAGDISGWLRAESGGFSPDTLPRPDHLILDLVSTQRPLIVRRGQLEPVPDEEGRTSYEFRFRDVPAGEYNLTLSSLDNYRWAPTSLLVAPPASNIEFLCYDLDETVALVFEVFDAVTQEPIQAFDARHIKQTNSELHGVFLHTGPLEGRQFPRDMPFDWSVHAEGYATAYGTEASFAPDGDRLVARVYLQRGWSTRFLVMGGKPSARPLPAAEIRLDGELVGRTGPNGALNVQLPGQPESIEVRYLDWVLVEPVDLSASTGARRQSKVTPVILRPPGEAGG